MRPAPRPVNRPPLRQSRRRDECSARRDRAINYLVERRESLYATGQLLLGAAKLCPVSYSFREGGMAQEDKANLHQLAKDCRTMASAAKTPEIRTELTEMAERFERLAQKRQHEEQAQSQGHGCSCGQ
jgi:hypothetical protein